METVKNIIADLYGEPSAMKALAREAGVQPRYLRLTDSPSANATNLLAVAKVAGKVPTLLRTLHEHHPSNPYFLAANYGELGTKGRPIEDVWRAPREAITGERDDMVPYEWLKDGYNAGRAVVRVEVRPKVHGSGFIVDGAWLVTNHHVIPDAGVARTTMIEFFYEKGASKTYRTGLNPDEGFVTDEEDDLTICGYRDFGIDPYDYDLDRVARGELGSYCQVIQHPAGGSKMLGVYDNRITYSDSERLQYMTDTLPGSSGSPVFDTQWRLVGIHRSGGWMRVPGGNGKSYLANEATPAAKVLALLDKLHQGF